jgi:hypothetical protein
MSCLFDSLGEALNLPGHIIRNDICNYLQTNPYLIKDVRFDNIIEWTNEGNMNEYIERMRHPSTWGGGTEIKCFVNMTGLNVIVSVQEDRPKYILFSSEDSTEKRVIVLDWNGSHYTFKESGILE